MPRPRYGSAREAAPILGLSQSQLNALRDRTMLEYEPQTQETRPIPDATARAAIYRAEVGDPPLGPARREPALAHYLRTRYLVCPTLCAYKMPGGTWRYNLTALERLQRDGPPGAGFAAPPS